MYRTAAFLSVATVLAAAPAAWADTASLAFKDLPAGHWAESAVTQVAVDRHFMRGYPDGTFRGDQPFTRAQLAVSVAELIKQLEDQTHSSWQTEGLAGYQFKDLPTDPQAAATVLDLANHYRLFEGIPGVTSLTFEGEKQVTRYEMAKVVHRLLRLGEQRGVVDPTVLTSHPHAFSDLPTTAWDYDSVKEVADRYQVMVGFPDGTFRGPEELTRYQFAASAAQTFPLVRELVQKTQDHQQQAKAEEAAPTQRYMEATPYELGAVYPVGGGWPGLAARAGGYYGSFMGLVDLGLAMGAPGGGLEHFGALDLGYSFRTGGGTSLTPYVGARVANVPAYTLGGLDYGLIGYYRTSPSWGVFLNARGTAPLGATSGTALGVFLGGLTAGVEFSITQNVGLSVEAGAGLWPGTTLTSATAVTPTGLVPTVGLNLTFKP